MRVAYRVIEPVTVLYARAHGPYQTSSREAWRRMDQWLDARGARARVKRAFGLFRDDPVRTAAGLVRYDACIPMTCGLEVEPDAGIRVQTLPGGAYAVHTHVGAHEEAGPLFSTLHGSVLPKRGLTVDEGRPFLAIYLNDPRLTREVHRRTELCVPVVPMRMPVPCNDDVDNSQGITEIASRVVGFC
jgi:DNA gyrase inhibitor GyrI